MYMYGIVTFQPKPFYRAHEPLAHWAVEGVLLSSELVPHLR